MATKPQPSTPTVDTEAESLAQELRAAPFVRIHPVSDPEALAAASVLAWGLRQCKTPFQIRPLTPTTEPVRIHDNSYDIGVGRSSLQVSTSLAAQSKSMVQTAIETTTILAPGLIAQSARLSSVVVSGLFGAQAVPMLSSKDALPPSVADMEKTPGVASPVADPIDGLTHSMLLHGPWSGDIEATADTYEAYTEMSLPLCESAGRDLSSQVTLDMLRSASHGRIKTALQGAIHPRPFAAGSFETLGGAFDVFRAVVREAPGTAVGFSLGADVVTACLEHWRTHANCVHNELQSLREQRFQSVSLFELDSALTPLQCSTVADVALAYMSAEPVTVVRGDRAIAIASSAPVAPQIAQAMDDEPLANDGWIATPHRAVFASCEMPTETIVETVRREVQADD
jgi:hypothetical protein